MNIEINVTNKIAINPNPDNQVIVCGNSDYVVHFNFDEEWDEYETKTARFSYDGSYQDVAFAGNSCSVPVLQKIYSVKVGVFAGDLHTTTPAIIYTKKSILCDSGVPAAPSEDVYAQIIELINAGMLKGDQGDTSYLYATVEDGELIIYGGTEDDITFALNDNGELEVAYGS